MENLTQQIDKVCAEKEAAISEQHFEQAAQFRDQEKKLRAQKEELLVQWKETRDKEQHFVGEDEILQIISSWTGIPLQRMEEKENQKLLNLEKDLQKEVIGQIEATEVIGRALRRSRADLKDPKRPIGSFMFLGSTGVGKTLLAKALADRMFGDKEALIQIDMSEYMEKFAVSRLIGSPPGYVGHEDGGQLTEAVRRKPYSVVLFDEIEKAHPDVVQLLLQVLEEGRLTDSLGRVVDFRNTILIMTSNVGADLLQRNTSMGFGASRNESNNYDKIREKILEETKKSFKPEFLNRINELVIFHPLVKDDLRKIVELEIEKLSKRLAGQKILIEVDLSAKDFLLEKGYDEKYGARPLRRAVERHLEDALAEAILKGEVQPGIPVVISSKEGSQELSFTSKKALAPAAPSIPTS